jgi:hypothetical protein
MVFVWIFEADDARSIGRYGDPFEMADQEKALANSLKQK